MTFNEKSATNGTPSFAKNRMPPRFRTRMPSAPCLSRARNNPASSGFWMRADWGPRMAAYNLMPPQWQEPENTVMAPPEWL